MVNTISFPKLGIGELSVPETFQILGVSVHLYGLIIACGIVLAYIFCSRLAPKYGINKDAVLDVILFGLPSAVICARLYYVVFEWSAYKNNPIDILKIWEGGLAIYGGIIGACISTFVYCKVKKVSIPCMFDVGAYGLLIGQICGRWGNFVNAEAYGDITDLPWGMQLNHFTYCVHPTFLYESLWNVCVLLFLFFVVRKKEIFHGEIFLSYLSLYGLGRFWIEGLRADSLYIGPMRVSQIVALICFAVCGFIVLRKCYSAKKSALTSSGPTSTV